jgi:hypothetical protein
MSVNGHLAETLWTRGAGFALSAQSLAELGRADAVEFGHPDPEKMAFNGRHSASLHLLVGFAFELLLKSAYVQLGGTRDIRELGHDLVESLNEAEAAGFSFTTPHLRWIVERIRGAHLAHVFRYGGPDTMDLPDHNLTLACLDTLARETGAVFLRR